MDTREVMELDAQYTMQTYGRFPVAVERAAGSVAYNTEGKKYIDFGSGIGVNSLGYCDAGWVAAVSAQLGHVQHISNLYYSPVATRLAQTLCDLTGYARVFFGNSGAEANECAIKLARKYSFDRYGAGRNNIVTLVNSFHGRTVTTLAATGQEQFHDYFFPFTGGFRYAEAGKMEELRTAAQEGDVCAVMLEFIQGEGGVLPLEEEYVRDLFAFCAERDILVIADEVQTGVGRTGTLYCCEQYGVKPDILTTAKGLGGGLPIGACLCAERLKEVLSAGTHGSTFGGNPAACAGALEVLRRVTEKGFLDEVRAKGNYLRAHLEEMPGIACVRGRGLMLGAELEAKNAKEVLNRCVEEGLFALSAKSALRFLPPLTIPYRELEEGLAVLKRVLAE